MATQIPLRFEWPRTAARPALTRRLAHDVRSQSLDAGLGGYLTLSLVTAALIATVALERALVTVRPPVPHLSVYGTLFDRTPIEITVTAQWERIPTIVTVDRLRTDHTLWRRMQFEDWDTVPNPLREQVLAKLLARHREILESPSRWRRLTALDWDPVPQPVRAMAFVRMAAFWAEELGVGAAYDLPGGLIADTTAAIVMAESWFDHRAVNGHRSENRDLGLAQASDFVRQHLDDLHRTGGLDFRMSEADYFDPYRATRLVAWWLDRMLDETHGRLDVAIRAYNRGSYHARRGAGALYLESVKDKRKRFVQNLGAPPAWAFTWKWCRDNLEAVRSGS